jgi:energy-coupling factor transport system permease protein
MRHDPFSWWGVAVVIRGDAVLARRAPVAKLAASGLLSIAVLTTRDHVALAVAILAPLALTPAFGLTYRMLLRRAAPALIGAAGVVISLSLFAADRSGTVLLDFGPFLVTTSVLAASLTFALRLLALAVSSILVFASTDPTDLADSLVQHTKAPPRFAIGALAAFRLLGLFREEWRLISMARRARGVDAGRNPLRGAKIFAGTTFALLVSAIRRGTRLAVAMDARGFDSGRPRTIARPSPFGWPDWLLMLAGLLLATLVATLPHR